MARFYANENFPLPAVTELRRLGHDVLTVQETGTAGQTTPDEAVLAFAREAGRVLLTLNRRHFIRLHNHGARVRALTSVTGRLGTPPPSLQSVTPPTRSDGNSRR